MVCMGRKIKTDPRLEAVCLPLSDEEFNTLEKQVIRDGCQDTLKVWDSEGELVLLDGHNRLKICRKNNIEYETSTIEINSIDEAVIWIVDNQKGRRNVATREQQDYISGKRYEAQKNINRERDKKGVFISDAPGDHNDHLGDNNQKNGPTAVKQAREEGITPISVRRNASFARGIDAVREVSPELAEKILKPEKDMPKIPKYAVAAIQNVKQKEPDKFVECIERIEDAMETKDKKTIASVIKNYVDVNEPTKYEKSLAREHNMKPEHVKYARDNGIPIEKLRTIPQLEKMNECEPKTCSNIWDGLYKCDECGATFEMFGAESSPKWCPMCGRTDVIRRM